MPLFLPHFIEENYLKGNMQGSFEGYALITDISGFTSIAENLIPFRDTGIEALSEIVNSTIGPAIDIVHRNGGWISQFAGDALTAVFRGDDNAGAACSEIISQLGKIRIDTIAGRHTFTTHTSLGKGSINWEIFNARKKFYAVWGNAVDNAVNKPISADYKINNLKVYPISTSNTSAVDFYPERVIENGMNGEFRNITVMFISLDISSFREDSVICADAIAAKGGYFNKMEISDKGPVILGIFGAPLAYRNMTERALDAAFSIIGESSGSVRIGICSGNAYAGYIGSSARGEYTAIGETVNRASRIMSAAMPGSILCDKSMNLEAYEITDAGMIKPKGYSSGLQIFDVKGKSDKTSGMKNYRTSLTEHLQSCIADSLSEGDSGALMISGKPGSGKSAFIDHYIRSSGMKYLRVNCDNPFREPLKPVMDAMHSKGLHKVRNMPEAYRHRMSLLYPSYAVFAGLSNDASFAEPKLIYSNAVEFIVNSVDIFSPDIIVLDDAHLIDDATLNVFRTLLHDSMRPFILICITDTGKPEIEYSAGSIEIGPLQDSELMEMCNDILDFEYPHELFNLIKAKTGGYPLYVLKAANLLNAHFRHTGNISDMSDISLDLDSMVVSEIDMLPRNEADVIKNAAVIGNRFDIRILQDITGSSDIMPDIAELCSKELLRNEEYGIYSFTHGAVRDSIYSMLLGSRRKELHAKTARSMLKRFKSKTAYMSSIAFHFENAGSKRASSYYVRAAEYETRVYLNDMALKHYMKAMTLTGEDPRIIMKVAGINEIQGNWDEALINYENALKLTQRDDAKTRADILTGIGALKWSRGEYEGAMTFINRAIRLYRKCGCSEGEAYATGKKGNIFWKQGKYSKALSTHEKQMDICRTLSNACVSQALGSIAAVHYEMGHFDEAISIYKEQLSMNRGKRRIRDRAIIYGNLGNISLQRGNYADAEMYNMKRLKIAEQIGDRMRIAISMGTLGNISRFRNRFDTALMFYEQALNEFRDLKHRNAESITIGNMGICYWRLGDFDNALKFYDMHYKTAESINDTSGMQRALGNTGNVLHRQGKFDLAAEKTLEQISITERINDMQHTAIGTGNLANIERDRGNTDKALELYSKAIELCRELGIKPFLSANLTELAKLHISLKRYDDALDAAKEISIISKELEDIEFKYEAELIEALAGSKEERCEKLHQMHASYDDIKKQAEIDYYLCMHCSVNTCARAIGAYRKLIERTDDFMYRQRIEDLSGML